MSAKAKSKLTPEQQKATMTRVLQKIKPYGFFVVCSLIVAAVSVAAQLYIPILCGNAIDMMLGKGSVDFAGVLPIIYEIIVVAVVAAFAQWLLSVCNNRITFAVSRDLRNAAMRKIQTLPLSYLDSHPSGDIVSRMVADVDTFADGLLMGFTQLFSGVLTILGTLLFMLQQNVPITLVVVCITPLSLVVASFLAKRSYKYFQSQSTVRGEQTALVNEMIEGQKVVQAFGHEAQSLEAFDEVNGRLQDVSLKAIFFSSMTNPATRFVNNIVYAGVGLVGAIYAVAGGITIGQLSIFLNYANQYTKPFNEISGVVTELQNALACAARVFELLDAEDQTPETENAAKLVPDGHVQIEDVSFRYLPDRPLIEGLSLDVKPGQRIAIVGPTGCGKTTLINLLMRFYDVNGGSIKVSGTDIRDVTRASLRGSYGMVLQDTWLRAGTVRENIAYGKPDASLDEVVAAAKAAHADSFIRRLPEGYDTVIAEDGGNISQGQKQLLCIARVMLCLPPMLILDEATSSIDTRTEVRIQAAFARMMQGRTSFIVAHRLSTIREADVILVMKDGQEVKMSKRSGSYITLRDLVDWVGRDAARYFLVSRKADAEFVFDVNLAVSKSDENPVYYLQYAHARICSVFRQATEKGFKIPSTEEMLAMDLSQLNSEKEISLMNHLADYSATLSAASEALTPHTLCFYLRDLAASFHAFYNEEHVLVEDEAVRNSRLALLAAVRQVLGNGLALLGVSAPERM